MADRNQGSQQGAQQGAQQGRQQDDRGSMDTGANRSDLGAEKDMGEDRGRADTNRSNR